jgi:hypothetical protein
VKKSQLSDKQLEEILGRMPKIKDHRDPRDIYQNIAQRVEKRRTHAWLIPSLAAAAVLFLAFILFPGMTDWNQSTSGSYDKSSSDSKTANEMDTASMEKGELESAPKEANKMMMDRSDILNNQDKKSEAFMEANPYAGLSALYEAESVEGISQEITYAIPDQNAQVLVPVTVTVPVVDQPWIDSFTETMAKLEEDEWGLTDFYPINAKWAYNEASKTLNMDVEEDHQYSDGSVLNTMLLEAMAQNLAGQEVEKLTFSTNGKKGIDLGNYGILFEQKIPVAAKEGRAFMQLSLKEAERPYLVPTIERFDTFEQAIGQMRFNSAELNLKASLPENFKPERIDFEKDKAVIKLNLLNQPALTEDFLFAIEAILLTAKDFGYKAVQIENSGTAQLGPFNLNEPIPVPKAPNKKNIK